MNMYRGYPHPYNMQYPYQSHAPPSYQYQEYPGKHYQSDRKDDKKWIKFKFNRFYDYAYKKYLNIFVLI